MTNFLKDYINNKQSLQLSQLCVFLAIRYKQLIKLISFERREIEINYFLLAYISIRR